MCMSLSLPLSLSLSQPLSLSLSQPLSQPLSLSRTHTLTSPEQPYQASCALNEAIKGYQYRIAQVLIHEYGADCNRIIGASSGSSSSGSSGSGDGGGIGERPVHILAQRGGHAGSVSFLEELLRLECVREVEGEVIIGPAVQVRLGVCLSTAFLSFSLFFSLTLTSPLSSLTRRWMHGLTVTDSTQHFTMPVR